MKAQEEISKKINRIFDEFDIFVKKFNEFSTSHKNLLQKIENIQPFSENFQKTEEIINQVQGNLSDFKSELSSLRANTEKTFLTIQDLVPSEIIQKLNSLELSLENTNEIMENKDKSFKRARTTRNEYLTGSEKIKVWIQNNELKLENQSLELQELQQNIQSICSEIGDIKNEFEEFWKNGQIIIENTIDDREKAIVQSNIDQLSQEFRRSMVFIEEKRLKIDKVLQNWTRFMHLYQIIIDWAVEKKTFLSNELKINSLEEAREKYVDYSVSFVHRITILLCYLLAYHLFPAISITYK